MNRIMKSSPVDSPTDQDLKWVLRSARSEDRRELWGRAQQACLHMAVNVADHVRSVAVLLSQPSVGVPIYAHSSLARVAIESAANAAHILDRNAPFPVRLGRGIALLISDSDKTRLTADRVPGNPYMVTPGPEANRRHEELLQLILRAKIEIIDDRRG